MTADIDLGYVTDDARGDGWHLMLGDACERLAEIETGSVGLSVCSPPFAQLYNYSPSPRDLSNSGSRDEFFEHYSYVVREQLRVTAPGRLACVHVQQITLQKVMHGVIGLTDFRGQVIAAFQDAGWIFHGEITVDKDPQAQAIRTKSQSLLFVTKERDSSALRPALADYVLLFRAPGDNQVPVKTDVTNEEWIAWARPIWPSVGDAAAIEAMRELGLAMPRPCWYDIRETNTLNTRVAKEDADERHICPLQLDLIERCVRLWSNPGELVLSPFAGIGSEGYVALKQRRRFAGVELKGSYWKTAVDNLRTAEHEMAIPALFDADEFAS
ncbi:DNA methyltransferase [Nonomuraea sp. NPDC023979]|uniref:DNA-methyltransferase n=1 Tax=Nonomuraea sp. NPDC023979 TaxID=3154796 RepID=UPI00340FC942